MFLLIFSVALGRDGRMVGGLPFLEFLAPGLVMMALIQSAFEQHLVLDPDQQRSRATSSTC